MENNFDSFNTVEGEHSHAGTAVEFKRWSVNRKKEAVLRMIRGESMEALSRELCIEAGRLEEWHSKALQGMEDALKTREGDPFATELDAAMRRIGEISLENELLRERLKKQNTLNKKRTIR